MSTPALSTEGQINAKSTKMPAADTSEAAPVTDAPRGNVKDAAKPGQHKAPAKRKSELQRLRESGLIQTPFKKVGSPASYLVDKAAFPKIPEANE